MGLISGINGLFVNYGSGRPSPRGSGLSYDGEHTHPSPPVGVGFSHSPSGLFLDPLENR